MHGFRRDGSLQKTPAHNYSQFKFRTYAPLAFRLGYILIELFSISLITYINYNFLKNTLHNPQLGKNRRQSIHYCLLSGLKISRYLFISRCFRKFRMIFEIVREKFLVSLCAAPMIELSNPGASGSIFYRTLGQVYILTTLNHNY